jgi:hypothetical protein
VGENEAEQQDRDQAGERELAEKADPRPQWRAEHFHLAVLG